MPPVLPPWHLQGLKGLADTINGVSQLLGQQQLGVCDPSGSIAFNTGPLFKYPNPTTNEGAYTKGVGFEIREKGKPVIRGGLLTWQQPSGSAEKVLLTIAGLVFLDAAGNVRVFCDVNGISKWTTAGNFAGYIYEF